MKCIVTACFLKTEIIYDSSLCKLKNLVKKMIFWPEWVQDCKDRQEVRAFKRQAEYQKTRPSQKSQKEILNTNYYNFRTCFDLFFNSILTLYWYFNTDIQFISKNLILIITVFAIFHYIFLKFHFFYNHLLTHNYDIKYFFLI